MRLVVDTGPLIALSKTGYLDLLPQLFDDIVIPAAVLGEVAKPGETRPGAEIETRSGPAHRLTPKRAADSRRSRPSGGHDLANVFLRVLTHGVQGPRARP
jgi:predicted nucleic acid-binding protein